QLEPYLTLDLGGRFHREAPLLQHLDDARQSSASLSGGLADDQDIAEPAADDARGRDRRRQMHHAADDLLRRPRSRDRPARIDRRQPRAHESAAEAVEE